jgi:acetyl-CoA acyltransferase 2
MAGAGREIWFLAAKRTAFGAFGGALRDLKATDLGTVAATAALAQSGRPAEQIDQVVFGNVLQTTPEDVYCARHIGLRAGVPIDRPALTVNRLSGSGFRIQAGGSRHGR